MTAIDNLWWGQEKENQKKTSRGNENKIFLWVHIPSKNSVNISGILMALC